MLTVLRDPGPRTRDQGGSGMLIENDDQTAANQYRLMEEADLIPYDFIPWNPYPWYINRVPSRAELWQASSAFIGLLELLPCLKVVLLQGKDAQTAWRIVGNAQPQVREKAAVTVLETYHPSNQALQTKSPAEREQRRRHRAATWHRAAEILHDQNALRDRRILITEMD